MAAVQRVVLGIARVRSVLRGAGGKPQCFLNTLFSELLYTLPLKCRGIVAETLECPFDVLEVRIAPVVCSGSCDEGRSVWIPKVTPK